MKLRIAEKAVFLALALAVLVSFTGFTAQCERIPAEVLRLHILANSNSDADQRLKMQVRDRVLQESAGLFAGCATRGEAEAAAKAALPLLRDAAKDEVRARGYDYGIGVELTNMYFTTREYEEITLPAGNYDALRVTIGEAKGRNWWCVIFPAMCLPAAQEKRELAQVLSPEQLEIVNGAQQGGFEVRFKAVEIYEQVRNWLSGK